MSADLSHPQGPVARIYVDTLFPNSSQRGVPTHSDSNAGMGRDLQAAAGPHSMASIQQLNQQHQVLGHDGPRQETMDHPKAAGSSARAVAAVAGAHMLQRASNTAEPPQCPSVVLVGVDATPSLGLLNPTNFFGVVGPDLLQQLDAELAAVHQQLPAGCPTPPVISYGHQVCHCRSSGHTLPWCTVYSLCMPSCPIAAFLLVMARAPCSSTQGTTLVLSMCQSADLHTFGYTQTARDAHTYRRST